MLRQRVLTALILLPLALGVILFAPLAWFDAAALAVVLLLALEYFALCAIPRPLQWLCAAATVVLLAAVFAGVLAIGAWLLLAAVILWLLMPLWFLRRPMLPGVIKALMGVVLLVATGIALHDLKALSLDGRWLLFAFLLVWAADTGAYFAGRRFGRHKLAPSISPGKTWEGVAGGLLLTIAAGALAVVVLPAEMTPAWFLLIALVFAVSVVGDLFESLLKRQAGVKDSGTLLPGHGGVLDRLDSLLAAAPMLIVAGTKFGIFEGVWTLGR